MNPDERHATDLAYERLDAAGLLSLPCSIVSPDGVSVVISASRGISASRAAAMSKELGSLPHLIERQRRRIGLFYSPKDDDRCLGQPS